MRNLLSVTGFELRLLLQNKLSWLAFVGWPVFLLIQTSQLDRFEDASPAEWITSRFGVWVLLALSILGGLASAFANTRESREALASLTDSLPVSVPTQVVGKTLAACLYTLVFGVIASATALVVIVRDVSLGASLGVTPWWSSFLEGIVELLRLAVPGVLISACWGALLSRFWPRSRIVYVGVVGIWATAAVGLPIIGNRMGLAWLRLADYVLIEAIYGYTPLWGLSHRGLVDAVHILNGGIACLAVVGAVLAARRIRMEPWPGWLVPIVLLSLALGSMGWLQIASAVADLKPEPEREIEDAPLVGTDAVAYLDRVRPVEQRLSVDLQRLPMVSVTAEVDVVMRSTTDVFAFLLNPAFAIDALDVVDGQGKMQSTDVDRNGSMVVLTLPEAQEEGKRLRVRLSYRGARNHMTAWDRAGGGIPRDVGEMGIILRYFDAWYPLWWKGVLPKKTAENLPPWMWVHAPIRTHVEAKVPSGMGVTWSGNLGDEAAVGNAAGSPGGAVPQGQVITGRVARGQVVTGGLTLVAGRLNPVRRQRADGGNVTMWLPPTRQENRGVIADLVDRRSAFYAGLFGDRVTSVQIVVAGIGGWGIRRLGHLSFVTGDQDGTLALWLGESSWSFLHRSFARMGPDSSGASGDRTRQESQDQARQQSQDQGWWRTRTDLDPEMIIALWTRGRSGSLALNSAHDALFRFLPMVASSELQGLSMEQNLSYGKGRDDGREVPSWEKVRNELMQKLGELYRFKGTAGIREVLSKARSLDREGLLNEKTLATVIEGAGN